MTQDTKRPSKEDLMEMYWGDDRMSMSEIAEDRGVSKQAVSNWFGHYDIDTRDSKYEKPDDETLRKWHHDEGLTVRQMAERVGCNYDTMRRWIHRAGIEIVRANRKHRWEPCAECGAGGGDISDLGEDEDPPDRIDGKPYGVEGKLCRSCYIKLWRRKKREEGEDVELDSESELAGDALDSLA